MELNCEISISIDSSIRIPGGSNGKSHRKSQRKTKVWSHVRYNLKYSQTRGQIEYVTYTRVVVNVTDAVHQAISPLICPLTLITSIVDS